MTGTRARTHGAETRRATPLRRRMWTKIYAFFRQPSSRGERFIYRRFRGVPPRLTSHDWSMKYVLYAEKNYNWFLYNIYERYFLMLICSPLLALRLCSSTIFSCQPLFLVNAVSRAAPLIGTATRFDIPITPSPSILLFLDML